eukprot:1745202-Prymnesium_polylepis.1
MRPHGMFCASPHANVAAIACFAGRTCEHNLTHAGHGAIAYVVGPELHERPHGTSPPHDRTL